MSKSEEKAVMDKKRIEKNINAAVPYSQSFDHIRKNIDYSCISSPTTISTKRKKKINIIFTSATFFVVLASTIATISIVLANTKQASKEQLLLSPMPNDLFSFYESHLNTGNNEPATPTTLNGLYAIVKDNSVETISSSIQQSDELNMMGDDEYHCYYVTNEVYETIENQPGLEPSYTVVPFRGLYAYMYLYQRFSDELKQQKIMECIVDINVDTFEINIGNYRLLDIVRYYKEVNYQDRPVIDFIPFFIEGGQAFIEKDYQKRDEFKYRFITLDYPSSGKSIFENNQFKYILNNSLANFSLLVEKEKDIEVVKTDIAYMSYIIKDNPNYYNEIDECIINKEFVYRFNYSNGDYLDHYDAIFDYNKLVSLFGFNVEE